MSNRLHPFTMAYFLSALVGVFSLVVFQGCADRSKSEPASSSRTVGAGAIVPTDEVGSAPTPVVDLASGCGAMTGVACDVFKAINDQRRAAGLVPLGVNAKCVALARAHASDMAAQMYLSHTSPTYGTFPERAVTFGVTGAIGENIASYQTTVTKLVNTWMSSSGHRSNILGVNYRSTGVGVANDSLGRPYYVQCFTGQSGD